MSAKRYIPNAAIVYVSLDGERVLLTDAAAKAGIPIDRVRERIRRGKWTIEQALGIDPPPMKSYAGPGGVIDLNEADERVLHKACDDKFQQALIRAGLKPHVHRTPCTRKPQMAVMPYIEARQRGSVFV